MELSFWQLFAAKIVLSFLVSFGFAWFIRRQSRAYMLGLLGGLLVMIVLSCAPIFKSDPIAGNRVAEEFALTFIPLLAAWLVSAAIAIGFARLIRWKE